MFLRESNPKRRWEDKDAGRGGAEHATRALCRMSWPATEREVTWKPRTQRSDSSGLGQRFLMRGRAFPVNAHAHDGDDERSDG
ncbi:hypothetical protein B296_00018858 [Ensete ventricosum]|uniref:Uncharacterized protein n=1 Tax=Ensete ventricosum TaxID=4639 RepID=A0A426ZK59_ENSVE|nr:hypothetical protein B296_00018858 [Ensete ventricosum]